MEVFIIAAFIGIFLLEKDLNLLKNRIEELESLNKSNCKSKENAHLELENKSNS